MIRRNQLVDTAIEIDVQPHRSKSDSLLLNLGDGKHARLQTNGRLTRAGEYYYQKTEQSPPALTDGKLVQRGNTEYLIRGQTAKVLRRFAQGEYVYTALGRREFENHQTQFLVHVPGIIKKPGAASRGRELMVPNNAFMSEITAPSLITTSFQKAFLKKKVEDAMKDLDKTSDGATILYQDSDPVVYDDSRPWTYDAQTIVEDSSGEVRTKTVLDRPLGAVPMLSSTAYCPEGFLDEAYKDADGNCVALQLSKAGRHRERDRSHLEQAPSQHGRTLARGRGQCAHRGRDGTQARHACLCHVARPQGPRVQTARAVAQRLHCLRDHGQPRLVLRHRERQTVHLAYERPLQRCSGHDKAQSDEQLRKQVSRIQKLGALVL